jgi:hypothetical protein
MVEKHWYWNIDWLISWGGWNSSDLKDNLKTFPSEIMPIALFIFIEPLINGF